MFTCQLILMKTLFFLSGSQSEVMKSVCNVGFPKIDNGYKIYHFRLPLQGPRPVVNFIWKGKKDDHISEEENTKIVVSLRGKQKLFYSRASKRTVKETLHRIGITKPHRAEYLLQTQIGDASAPNDQNQAAILERVWEKR